MQYFRLHSLVHIKVTCPVIDDNGKKYFIRLYFSPFLKRDLFVSRNVVGNITLLKISVVPKIAHYSFD